MSLKAKIEAVIYASEEPVTLAQLAGLLGHEAQAELDHIDSAQHALALADSPADQDAMNSEVLSEAETVETTDIPDIPEHTLDEALHVAASEEAAAARAVREHAAADAAAMSSAEAEEPSVDPEESPVEEVDPSTESGQGTDSPMAEATAALAAGKDERRLVREARERERRLRDYFRSILEQLIADYATSERGLEIREVAGGYRFATKPEYHDAVRGFVKSLKPPLKLSLQALETLAVVAYKQPVTAPEISEIRGVDSGGVLGSLLSRKLITTAGRKQVIGRPILYKTSRDFLLRFGLKDINELPSIEEFEKMAGELAEQEEIPMDHNAPETPGELEQERDEVEPQADGDSSTPIGTVADETVVDGRISGPPPSYDTDQLPADGADSPALDAEVQSSESEEGDQDEERR
jgi:segregation and condensation protein B